MGKKENLRAAQIVFNFFKYETDCLNRRGELTIVPKYIVAIGDDPISAFYACQVFKKAQRQLGIRPKIICCGGYYQFSKHINAKENGVVLTEGRKMAKICQMLCPECKTIVLDEGSNVVQSVTEVAEFLSSAGETERRLIFCPTQRLSKRLERVVAFSEWRNKVKIKAYYYVPGENESEVLQAYNGMKFANGTLALNEAANLYLRMTGASHIGRYMKQLDCDVPKWVHEAGIQLVEKYPLRYRSSWSDPLQCICLLWYLYINHNKIQRDLQQKICEWSKKL